MSETGRRAEFDRHRFSRERQGGGEIDVPAFDSVRIERDFVSVLRGEERHIERAVRRFVVEYREAGVFEFDPDFAVGYLPLTAEAHA